MNTHKVRRVTVVTETFYPEINGVANTLRFLVEGLKKQGIAIQIIRPKQSREDKSSNGHEADLVTVAGLPIPGYKQLKFGLPMRRKISRALKRFNSDVMYVATEGPLGLAALRAAKRKDLPVLSGFHTNFHEYFEHYHLAWLKSLVFRYLRAFHNATAGTLVPTKFLVDELREKGFRRLDIMARGVDSKLFSPIHRSVSLRQEWNVREPDPVLIYVGRIAHEKNINLAFESFEAFKKINPSAKMVLVGDGPMRQSLENSYPEAIFCGELRGQILAEHYASADIFLFPSLTDTYGNVVLEAMASGLHVLAFDYAAAGTLIIPEQNGSLAKFGDDTAFIEQMKNMASTWKQGDPLRSKARLTSQNLSWDGISEQFLNKLELAKEVKSDGTNEKSVCIPKV